MKITREDVDGVAILVLQGKILNDDGADAFREVIVDTLKSGAIREIILDMTDVPYMDSSGLAEVIRAHTMARKTGGRRLALVNLHPKIKNILAITKLLAAFNIYNTREEALKSV